ncbi:hypothetical protein [Yinghuangia sp. YIM S09857]|uniref:hypothetical protein n=1 Tax=Yinghuangia sp. YIM S09857 TaxID=3436929 RepID=UPI003F529E94
MEGTTRPTASRQPLHQIVYRWQRQDLFGRKGLGPAATSLPVADLARLVPDLSEAVAAEFGGDGAPLTSTSLIHVDSLAAVVHRVASEFEQGRLGNHAHVLLGTRAALTPHAVLALDGWGWRTGQPQLAEIPVGRRLARIPDTILDDALAERAFQLRDAARTQPEPLTVVLAAVLRRPTMGFSVRLADAGDPVALLWGLFDLITVPLPGPLTFSTYETADGTTRPRFVVVPRWPSQLWSGRHRVDPDAEARTDVFREAAELMVARYVEDDWDTMYPLLRGLQGLRRHQPYDRAVEIRDRFAADAGRGAGGGSGGAAPLRLPNEEVVPGESAEALSRAAAWQEARLAGEAAAGAGTESGAAAGAESDAESGAESGAKMFAESFADSAVESVAGSAAEPVAVPVRDVPPDGPGASLDQLFAAPAAVRAEAPETAVVEDEASPAARPGVAAPLPRRTPNSGHPAIPTIREAAHRTEPSTRPARRGEAASDEAAALDTGPSEDAVATTAPETTAPETTAPATRSVLPRRPSRGVRSARTKPPGPIPVPASAPEEDRGGADAAVENPGSVCPQTAEPPPGRVSEPERAELAGAPEPASDRHRTQGRAQDQPSDPAADPVLAEPEAFPLRAPAGVPLRPEDPPPSAGNAERERWKRRGVYDEDIDALEFAADQVADGGADRAVAFVEDVVALAVALELADLRLLPYVAEHFPRRLDDAPKWTQRERQAVRDVLLHPVRYGDRLVEAGVETKVVRRMFERLVRVVLTLEKDPSRPLRALALDLMSDRRRLAPYPVLDDVLRRSSWEPAYYQELGRRWAELNPPADTEAPPDPPEGARPTG